MSAKKTDIDLSAVIEAEASCRAKIENAVSEFNEKARALSVYAEASFMYVTRKRMDFSDDRPTKDYILYVEILICDKAGKNQCTYNAQISDVSFREGKAVYVCGNSVEKLIGEMEKGGELLAAQGADKFFADAAESADSIGTPPGDPRKFTAWLLRKMFPAKVVILLVILIILVVFIIFMRNKLF